MQQHCMQQTRYFAPLAVACGLRLWLESDARQYVGTSAAALWGCGITIDNITNAFVSPTPLCTLLLGYLLYFNLINTTHHITTHHIS